MLWCQGGWKRFGAALVPCRLCGCCSCTSWLLLLSQYLFPSPAPLPPCYGGVFCKPSSFEQCQLHVEADFLYLDAVFLFQLVVSGSS